MKFLIINSSNKQSNKISQFIQKYFGLSSIIIESSTYAESADLIHNKQPQVILSSGSIDGKSIFKLIERFTPNADRNWFLTDKLAGNEIKAIRLGIAGICDFETEQELLLKTLNKVQNNDLVNTQPKMEKPIGLLDKVEQTLIIQTESGFSEIKLSSILYIEQIDTGVIYQTDNGEAFISKHSLMLTSNSLLKSNFKVVSSTVIVNVNKIQLIKPINNGCTIQFENMHSKNIQGVEIQKLMLDLKAVIFS